MVMICKQIYFFLKRQATKHYIQNYHVRIESNAAMLHNARVYMAKCKKHSSLPPACHFLEISWPESVLTMSRPSLPEAIDCKPKLGPVPLLLLPLLALPLLLLPACPLLSAWTGAACSFAASKKLPAALRRPSLRLRLGRRGTVGVDAGRASALALAIRRLGEQRDGSGGRPFATCVDSETGWADACCEGEGASNVLELAASVCRGVGDEVLAFHVVKLLRKRPAQPEVPGVREGGGTSEGEAVPGGGGLALLLLPLAAEVWSSGACVEFWPPSAVVGADAAVASMLGLGLR